MYILLGEIEEVRRLQSRCNLNWNLSQTTEINSDLNPLMTAGAAVVHF